MKSRRALSLLSASCATLAIAGSAAAQEVAPEPSPRVVEQPTAPVVVERPLVVERPRADTVIREESVPNTPLIVSGAVLFGATYIPSVIVASSSGYDPDDNLVVPLAGPWLDLANRGDCGASGTPSCNAENTNRVLLVADGILQGVGALQIVGGFLFPAKRTVVETARSTVQVAPRFGANSLGLAASGRF